MARYDEHVETSHAAQHLLLVGPSKSGKTAWMVRLIQAGYHALFIDTDNGDQTLRPMLAGNPEAQARVHYFRPKHMAVWFECFFGSQTPVWNATLQAGWARTIGSPTDELVVIRRNKIPANVIIMVDSWTSLASDSTQSKLKKLNVEPGEADKFGRELYSSVGIRLTSIAMQLQAQKNHVIAIGHPGTYEIKENPLGSQESVKEKNLKILAIVQVPVSSSMPHGYNLSKYFSAIGWLGFDRLDKRILDFTPGAKRVAGGFTNKKGSAVDEHSGINLFGPPAKVLPEEQDKWITYTTYGEYAKLLASRQTPAAKPKPKPKPKTIPSKPKPKAPIQRR